MIGEQIKYAWRDRKPTLLTVVLLLLVVLFVLLRGIASIERPLQAWDQIWGVLVDIATFLIAMMLWFNEFNRSWLRSLPLRFDVVFVFNGQPVMRCEYAHLNSELDIRPLGQQIGLQMVKSHTRSDLRLEFRAPSIELAHLGAEPNPYEGNYCNHYRVTFDLQDLPAGVSGNECLVWSPPFQVLAVDSESPGASDGQGGRHDLESGTAR